MGSGGDAEGDTLTSIESVIGSNHDDVLIIGDTNFNTFSGLSGSDTIRVSGSGVSLDLGDHTISGIEVVDLTGTGANSLDLRAADVRQASGTLEAGKAVLRIDGNADDRVNFLDNGWTRLEATRTIDGTEYAVFDHADARVLVILDIAGTEGETDEPSEIEGTAGPDTLTGTDGDDTISGLGDNDTIEGKGGADTIDGGSGKDTASYKTSNAGVTVNLTTGAGSGGHAKGDSLSGIENLDGSNHADRLTGDGGANTIRGLDGNDTIEGMAGADRIDGGAGTDTASYETSNAGVTVNLGSGKGSGGHARGDKLRGIENLIGSDHNDFLLGNYGNNVIAGGDGHDKLDGGWGSDRLEGGKGNDILSGGNGADVIDGGIGLDTASYNYSHKGVTVNLVTGRGSGGYAQGDQLTSIERVIGSRFDDTLIVGDTNFDAFDGLAGTDTIRISGSGVSVDVGDHAIRNIEIVDLTGTGANSLQLGAADVQKASGVRESGKSILRVEGNADDRVVIDDSGWTTTSRTRTIDGNDYLLYKHANALILIDTDISVSGTRSADLGIELLQQYLETPPPDGGDGGI